MGDRVAVLKDGVLQQCDSPRALYDEPANIFVAGFIGSPSMNLTTAQLDGEHAWLGGMAVPLPRAARSALSAAGHAAVTVGVRPESLRLVDSDSDSSIAMTVDLVEELGSDAYLYGTARSAGDDGRFIVRTDPRTQPLIGQTVNVAIRDAHEVHLFHPETGDRLR